MCSSDAGEALLCCSVFQTSMCTWISELIKMRTQKLTCVGHRSRLEKKKAVQSLRTFSELEKQERNDIKGKKMKRRIKNRSHIAVTSVWTTQHQKASLSSNYWNVLKRIKKQDLPCLGLKKKSCSWKEVYMDCFPNWNSYCRILL